MLKLVTSLVQRDFVIPIVQSSLGRTLYSYSSGIQSCFSGDPLVLNGRIVNCHAHKCSSVEVHIPDYMSIILMLDGNLY